MVQKSAFLMLSMPLVWLTMPSNEIEPFVKAVKDKSGE